MSLKILKVGWGFQSPDIIETLYYTKEFYFNLIEVQYQIVFYFIHKIKIKMLQHVYYKGMKRARMFSTHCRVAVIGGGTAGLASSAQLAKSGCFTKEDITVFDPSSDHHYQPSYTMIGGGVLGHKAGDVKSTERTYVKRSMAPIKKYSLVS